MYLMSEKNNIIQEVEQKQNTIKTCIICESNEAHFYIKGAPLDCYCNDCAVEAFGDVSYLEKM